MNTPTKGPPKKLLSPNDIVILITLVALAAVFTPMLMRRQQQRNQEQCESNESSIGTACEMYSTDNSGRYPRSLSALTPNYLHVLPTCPAAASDTYSQAFESTSNPDVYTLFCSGYHHPQLSPNKPAYWTGSTLVSGH